MILVTGVTGHTGKHFYDLLLQSNYTEKIRLLVRESSNIDFIVKSNLDVELFKDNLNNIKGLSHLFENVHTVVHIYNIHHSLDVLHHAISNGVKRIILVHTAGVYSKHKTASSTYQIIERQIFDLSHKKDIEVIVLRPTMIYGDMIDKNISKFIRLVDRYNIIPVVGRGNNLIQPIYSRDLAIVIFNLLSMEVGSKYKIYDLSGYNTITLKELFELIAKIMNKKLVIIPVPYKIALIASKIFKLITLNKIDIVEKVQRMTEDRSLSHDVARQELKFNPISIEQGLTNQIDHFLSTKERVMFK